MDLIPGKKYEFSQEFMSQSFYQGIDGVIPPTDHNPVGLGRLENSNLYYAEPKCDGNWAVIFWTDDGRSHMFSRSCLEKRDAGFDGLMPAGTAVVGEAARGTQESVTRREKLGHGFIDGFDILFINYEWTGNNSSLLRKKMLIDAVAKSPNPKAVEWIQILPTWYDHFMDHFAAEREGLVLKRRTNGAYAPNTRTTDWYKVKKCHVYDMVIMDVKLSTADTKVGEPMAQCISCGQYVNGQLKYMVDVGSMPHEWCKKFAQDFESYRGQVVMIRAYDQFKSGGLRHPSLCTSDDYGNPIDPIRTDKKAEECTFRYGREA